jgi:NADPH:quinone reductase-like Zn-dependent oxidoreductase
MVLVKVEASAVNAGDARARGLQVAQPMRTLMRLVLGVRRLRKPILGTVYAGTVVALGEGATAFRIGDRVFGATPGMSFGGHARYAAVPQDSAIARMPQGADAGDLVSLVFGGATALFFLEKAGAAPGKKALIYGASGAVGSMAVQIANIQGMTVTAVASGKNRELVTSLGADNFLAYDAPGFTLPAAAFDLVLDAVGKLPGKLAQAALKPGGQSATVGGTTVSKETAAHMQTLAEWFKAGKLKPVIQQRFAFEDIIKAHELVDSGRKVGSAVLMMGSGE